MNVVVLCGNATRDPELRYTPSGAAVAEFGLAVNERRKGANGEYVDEVVFVDLVTWSRTAELANQYVKKGTPVLIRGKLKLDQWTDKEGQKRSRLRVVVETLQLLGGRDGGSQRSSGSQRQDEPSNDGGHDAPPFDDSIPF